MEYQHPLNFVTYVGLRDRVSDSSCFKCMVPSSLGLESTTITLNLNPSV